MAGLECGNPKLHTSPEEGVPQGVEAKGSLTLCGRWQGGCLCCSPTVPCTPDHAVQSRVWPLLPGIL